MLCGGWDGIGDCDGCLRWIAETANKVLVVCIGTKKQPTNSLINCYSSNTLASIRLQTVESKGKSRRRDSTTYALM